MPSIDDFVVKNKKFHKKSYRPWILLDEVDALSCEKETSPPSPSPLEEGGGEKKTNELSLNRRPQTESVLLKTSLMTDTSYDTKTYDSNTEPPSPSLCNENTNTLPSHLLSSSADLFKDIVTTVKKDRNQLGSLLNSHIQENDAKIIKKSSASSSPYKILKEEQFGNNLGTTSTGAGIDPIQDPSASSSPYKILKEEQFGNNLGTTDTGAGIDPLQDPSASLSPYKILKEEQFGNNLGTISEGAGIYPLQDPSASSSPYKILKEEQFGNNLGTIATGAGIDPFQDPSASLSPYKILKEEQFGNNLGTIATGAGIDPLQDPSASSSPYKILKEEQFGNNLGTTATGEGIDPLQDPSASLSPYKVLKEEQFGNNLGTIIEGDENKKESLRNHPKSFVLVGFQKRVFLYIVRKCEEERGGQTGPIYKQDWIDCVSADIESVKTTLKRLIEKGFIYKVEARKGQGGFTSFGVPKVVMQAFQQEGYTAKNPLKDESVFEKNLHKEGLFVYKSHQKNDFTYTNKEEEGRGGLERQREDKDYKGVKEEFKVIDISPLEDIGFSYTHLIQFQNLDLTAEMIQDSIYYFAFDLNKNKISEKIRTTPLSYFIGSIRSNGMYAAPSNYEDPKTIAMRQYLETKKGEKEARKKIQEELFYIAFEEWKETLSQENVIEIIPEKRYREPPFLDEFLKSHFRNKLWSIPKDLP